MTLHLQSEHDQNAAAPEAGASISRNILAVLIFALSFAVVSVALSLTLRAAEPEPDLLVLTPKLEHFRDNQDQYNTIFLGTSRTFYHIVPIEVESAAHDAGCPGLSVYNFGVFGLNGAEQDWLIGEILNRSGSNLKTLIIEDPLPAERRVADVTSERARYFHKPALYSSYANDILSFPESTPKHLFRLGVFGYGVLHDLSGVGRAADAVFPSATPHEPDSFDFTFHGFEALGSIRTADIDARRATFEAQPERFADYLSAFAHGPESDPSARAAYHAKRLSRIEQAGVQAGLFISPDAAELRRTPWVGKAASANDPDAMVLNYNLPDQYTDIFERHNWFDFNHLNEAGARLLSQKIGRQLCAEQRSVE